MRALLFIVCAFVSICCAIVAYAAVTTIPEAGRWFLVVPAVIAACVYAKWSWNFRPWVYQF